MPIRGKAGYEHALSIAQAHPVVTIDGVGDAAFGTFNGTFGAAKFHKGDSVVNVLISPLDANQTSQDKVMVLVKLAASRL